MNPRRVVITGIGPVTRAGVGADSLFSALCDNQCPVEPVPARFLEHYPFKSRFHVPAPDVDFSRMGIRTPMANMLQPEDVMTLVGTRLALEDAGVELVAEQSRLRPAGSAHYHIVIGTGMGGLEAAFRGRTAHCIRDGDSVAAFSTGAPRFSRMVVPQAMPSSVAAWVSMLFGSHGPARTVNASCASGTVAVGEAFRSIKDGYCDDALAGGVEHLDDSLGTVMRGFDMLGALTRSASGRPTPFSQNRTGFLFAQGGACMLVLEEYEKARSRGARIYAELVDYYSNSDAYSIVRTDPDAMKTIELLSHFASLGRIDYINSHGTGTKANDETEAHAVRTVFGGARDQPLVNATKGILGHTIGAAGAIETAVAAMTIRAGVVHGSDVEEPMEDLNLVRETLRYPVECALSLSCGFGGHNAGLLLQRCE